MKVKPNNYIAIEFPSRSVNEGLARAAVAAFAAQLDPTLDELGDIKTAVSEAVTNAIVHAYPQEIGKIALRVSIFDGNVLEITVRDWGCGIADVEKARFAALLHDATKRLSMAEQLALCEHYHIALDELEQHALKLLHAKTGAALARDVFGADDEVYNAILWHTTGKANMTVLEKVLYLADYIEPNRDFDGVDDLRKAVWEDLDRGLAMGLAMTVEEMKERGNPVHYNTLEALEYLRGHNHE